MRTISKVNQLKRAAGFTMMELLVAVLVMGVGILGVTGLQLVSLQNNQEALLRAEAVQLAYDILDRIRVNPGAGVPGVNYDGVDLGDDPPNAADCLAGVCNAGQMADFDVASWKCSLGGHHAHATCEGFRDNAPDDVLPEVDDQPGLQDGDGSIAVDANGLITVTVEWTGFNNETQTIAITSQG